jgi:hypothetical protein
VAGQAAPDPLAFGGDQAVDGYRVDKGAKNKGFEMNNSDDSIEEMVSSAISLYAEDAARRTAALQWLDQRVAVVAASKDNGHLEG